jgi:hypothetical protein
MHTADQRRQRTEKARAALRLKTARKYEARWAEELRFLGYTVLPPSRDTPQGKA